MASELASRKCVPCSPDTPALTREHSNELLDQLEGNWSLGETPASLAKNFEFRNFRGAFGFATRIALLAEEQGHHPDLALGWGYVNITLTTHVAKGLTENDFIMAAKIDRIAEHEPIKN